MLIWPLTPASAPGDLYIWPWPRRKTFVSTYIFDPRPPGGRSPTYIFDPDPIYLTSTNNKRTFSNYNSNQTTPTRGDNKKKARGEKHVQPPTDESDRLFESRLNRFEQTDETNKNTQPATQCTSKQPTSNPRIPKHRTRRTPQRIRPCTKSAWKYPCKKKGQGQG